MYNQSNNINAPPLNKRPPQSQHYGKQGERLFIMLKVAQWNLSKVDTLGATIFVCFRQVSGLDRLCLWDFNQ